MEKDFILAGFGGQGVLLAGEVLANAFMVEGKNVTWYPSYGAEMRGGTVNCTVTMADDEVSSLQNDYHDFAIVLNQASFDKFINTVKVGGTIIVNTSLAVEKRIRNDINYVFAPITEMASNLLGNTKMANILSLGILSKFAPFINLKAIEQALYNVLPPHRHNLIPKNIEALKLGYEYDLLKV